MKKEYAEERTVRGEVLYTVFVEYVNVAGGSYGYRVQLLELTFAGPGLSPFSQKSPIAGKILYAIVSRIAYENDAARTDGHVPRFIKLSLSLSLPPPSPQIRPARRKILNAVVDGV
jgi:hypothetical protein